MLKRILTAILLSYLCAGLALAGGYTRGGGARRPVAYFPLSISGTIHPDSLAAATACWNFDSAVGANYTDDCAGLYTMTVNGAPTLESNDGTWPNGLSGAPGKAWDFDGVTPDYLSRLDDGSFDMDPGNNPTGNVSFRFAFTPSTIGGAGQTIFSKLNGNDGWFVTQVGADLRFYTYDGALNTNLVAVGVLAAHRPAFVTVTYERIGGAADNQARIYVDNLVTVSSNVMRLISDSAGNFAIAAHPSAGNSFTGLIQDLAIDKGGIFTEADHDAAFARWQGRNSAGNDDIVVSVASASPPAIQQKPCATEDGCFIDQPANSGAVGVHGEFSSTGLNSKWWRGSCETADGGGHCQGWLTQENQGAGAATVVVDRVTTDKAHGVASMKFTADGGGMPRYALAKSECIANWIGQDIMLLIEGKTLSGTADCDFYIEEYDTAACGVLLAAPQLLTGINPGIGWNKIKATHAGAAWNVATSSWYAILKCNATGTANVTAWDAAMALQAPATFATDASCTSDADADAICTATIPSITSPFSANGAMTVVGTWRSPWAGVDLIETTFLLLDGLWFGANAYGSVVLPVTNEPSFYVFDNASAVRQISLDVLDWAADTDYILKFRTGGNDDLGLYWNSTWQMTVAGAGTGTRSAAQTTTYVGSSNATPANVWTRELYIYPRTRF